LEKRKKLLLQTLLFSVLLEIISLIIYFTVNSKYITVTLPYLVPFFFAVSFLSNLILLSVTSEKPASFIRAFMMVTFLRFIFFIIIMVIYAFMFRGDAVNFLISFLLVFILFLIFDVVFLVNNLPKK